MTRSVLAALAVAVASLSACLSRPPLVPQTFSIDPPPVRLTPPSAGARVISLKRVEVAAQFDRKELLYRTGDHRLERDPYASFAAPPGDMITEAIRGYLRNARFVRDVVSPGSELPADLLIEVYVSDLSGDFARPDDVAAVMTLQLQVSPAAASGQPPQPLLRKEYSRRIRLSRRTADAVVTAWNQGLADIMKDFVGDLEVAVARASPEARGNP
jgi:uncharacterized lipoprotein YmbA